MTREAVTYVEIDVTYCANTFGVPPCTAVLGTAEEVAAGTATGTAKCFNTLRSCQDIANFTDSPVTLRFSIDTGHNSPDIEALPILRDVSISPARISLGEDLGKRESVSLTFVDQRHPDTGPGFDKYHTERDYNPYEQGTLWGKFRARHPYMTGRALRLYRGFSDQALADMEIRHYIIESTSGPGVDGRFSVVAKDPLKVLDGDRALAPVANTGSLSASLASGGTSATLTPTGIGNAEYPSSGKIAIGGKEIMSFTRSGDTLTVSARGSNGTTALAHSAGDRVQLVLEYDSDDPADIISDLMTTYGGVDSSMIPLTEWQAETAAHSRQLYGAVIAEPTPVRALVGELIQQAGFAIWSDVVSQTIRLQVLREIPTDAKLYDESIIQKGSLTISEQPDKRISRVITYFAQRNPLEGLEDPSNYRSLRVTVDTDAEEFYGVAKNKKIFSRWIPFGGGSVALRGNDIQLGRFVDPPRKATFGLFRSELEDIDLGGGYRMEAFPLQAFDGSNYQMPGQVVSLRSDAASFGVEFEELNWTQRDSSDLSNRVIPLDTNANDLNLREIHDNIYPEPVAGDEVTFTVPEAVTIGASSVSKAAITTGPWPTDVQTGNRTSGSAIITGLTDTADFTVGIGVTGAGIPNGTKVLTIDSGTQVTLDANATSGSSTATSLTFHTVRLNLVIAGRVQGAGGKGGKGAIPPTPGTNGQAGGPALVLLTFVDLVLKATAKLWGGGGGGGGGATQTYTDHRGGGGGGGAGSTPGAGGSGPGNAESGDPGTKNAGGDGGRSWTNFSGLIFEPPELESQIKGGDGGGPGQAGESPGDFHVMPGNGGAAGKSIDGVSFADIDDQGADIRGPQSN